MGARELYPDAAKLEQARGVRERQVEADPGPPHSSVMQTYAFLLASVGTAIAVTGIGDMCLTELVVNATRARPARSEERRLTA